MHSEQSLSSPSAEVLAAWRVFIETAWAVTDVLDAELVAAVGIGLRWYDVLVHIEETPEDGATMTEIANRILASKSGLTRVIDTMEKAGLVARVRPPEDRRVVRVVMTPAGAEKLRAARVVHRDGIRRHFGEHLTEDDPVRLAGLLAAAREHVRPLRPGRIRP